MGYEREDDPMQETPQGHTIPVPTREDVLRDLEKVAKPERTEGEDGSGPSS